MSRIALFGAASGALVLAALAACADSNEDADVPTDDGGTLPANDGAVADGDLDATGSDAPIDASPPECSQDGFCHTVVPKNQTLRAVWSDGAGTAWAVSAQGAILRYNGSTWQTHTTVTGPLTAVWGSGPTNVWVGGPTGLRHGTGASPTSLVFASVATPGLPTPITSIWGTGENDVWAAGTFEDLPERSRLLHYRGAASGEAGASAWSLEEIPDEPIQVRRVFGSATSGLWLAGQWRNPNYFSRREIFLLRRKPGRSAWQHEQLPSDPDDPNSEGDFDRFYDAAMSMDGTSVWVIGRTHGRVPAFASGTSSDSGETFTFTFGVTGNTRLEPAFNAVVATGTNTAFISGDYGAVRYWSGGGGGEWKPSRITATKFPLTTPFYAMGGRAGELWFVGDNVALRRDPSKVQP